MLTLIPLTFSDLPSSLVHAKNCNCDTFKCHVKICFFTQKSCYYLWYLLLGDKQKMFLFSKIIWYFWFCVLWFEKMSQMYGNVIWKFDCSPHYFFGYVQLVFLFSVIFWFYEIYLWFHFGFDLLPSCNCDTFRWHVKICF